MSKGPKFHASLNLDSGQNKTIVHSISPGTFYCRINSHYIYLGTTLGIIKFAERLVFFLCLSTLHKWQTQDHIKAKANKAIHTYFKKSSFTFPTSRLLHFVSKTLCFPLTNFEVLVPQQTLKKTEWPPLLHGQQLYFSSNFAYKCHPAPSTSEAHKRRQVWPQEERTGGDFHCDGIEACG